MPQRHSVCWTTELLWRSEPLARTVRKASFDILLFSSEMDWPNYSWLDSGWLV